ncbi:MAG TPA: F0F1 ATP synthase subunit A [Chitinophagaceae bacterium]|nr:F0F1 ATP synthase subunit A [Chitinophagaceae bacterium]
MCNKLKYFLLVFAVFFTSFSLFANKQEVDAIVNTEEELNISEIIFGHIYDSYEWHVFKVGNFELNIHLPILIYDTETGFHSFSSKTLKENNNHYSGYTFNEDGKIISEQGNKIYDISLTKNTVALIIASLIILIIFIRLKGTYMKRGSDQAPRGWQNAVESAILFIRDDVAKPNIGKNYKKFTPFLLSLFFFIWIINMLGLIPGGANLSGNIAFTAALAFVTFMIMLFSSKKSFWSHLFNPPGLPIYVVVILVPIELISLIIKPVALTVRLFANMLAGHLVILSFVLLIFIFAQMNQAVGAGFTVISVALQIFMLLIKVMVAAIQAFIFANLSAVFIGSMMEEEEVVEEVALASEGAQ